jgi:hypothetical protein
MECERIHPTDTARRARVSVAPLGTSCGVPLRSGACSKKSDDNHSRHSPPLSHGALYSRLGWSSHVSTVKDATTSYKSNLINDVRALI